MIVRLDRRWHVDSAVGNWPTRWLVADRTAASLPRRPRRFNNGCLLPRHSVNAPLI
ncbi:MAG: hypothetical protein SVV67_07680 [Bacillota bacterium]|nr:hypothetical protein [Bacillota bacterium]